MTPSRTHPATRAAFLQAVVIAGLVAWLYYAIIFHLVRQWWIDPNFSHGFFVPLVSSFIIWQKRSHLQKISPKPSFWGLPIIFSSLLLLVMGVFGAELFLSRVSLLVLLWGLMVFFVGWQFFRAVLFPWALLIFMIPLPALVMNEVTFPLQLAASKVAAAVLPVAGVPVFREGNIINIPAMPLEIAEACSGIRSLISLITLTVMYGYLFERRIWVRFLLALAAAPIAVAANSLRIIVAGILVQYWGPPAGEGFFHLFSGWLIFVVSLVLIAGVHKLITIQLPKTGPSTTESSC